jgi:DNA-directed RNA polymerase specialized sigma24 family protein
MSPASSGSTRAPGEWAAVYRDEQQLPAARRQALTALIAAYTEEIAEGAGAGEAGRALPDLLAPEIQRVARQVARGAGHAERDEFVQESLSLILARRSKTSPPRICGYRPEEEGALSGWLLTVLGRCWIDRLRRAGRRPRTLGDPARVPAADPGPTSWPEATLTSPFSEVDLDQLASWDACYRLEVLCLGGLWLKVPPPLWEEWGRAYETTRKVSLGRPFPPDEFLALDDPAARTVPLARLLGRRANTLSVRWLRGRRRLEELDFVRDLRGFSPAS